MYRNEIKALWDEGGKVVNGWLSIASPFTAEIMASQDYDSLTIDMQHGAVDYPDAVTMFQAMTNRGKTLMARVPWLEPGGIMKAMDAGAMGIICPMVNSGAEAAQLVDYMRYPPLGGRSSGPTRAKFAYGADYMDWANDEMLIFAMIETGEAMKNLDEIVATPGLDAVYVGPSDLTLGYTNGRLPAGMDREEPEMIEAIQRVVQAAHNAGIKAALHTASPSYAARGFDWGYDMVTLGGDAIYLAQGSAASVSALRGSM